MTRLNNDLISRKALLEAMKKLSFPIELDSNVMTMFTHDVVDAITNAPTIEADSGEAVLYAVQGYKEALKLHNGATLCTEKQDDLHTLPLYTSPPKREWRDLSEAEQTDLLAEMYRRDYPFKWLITAASAKLKEVNEYD